MSSARAVRLANMMGLQQLDTPNEVSSPTLMPPKDWAELEERRRTFWGIFCLDSHCAISTGWPHLIDPSEVRQKVRECPVRSTNVFAILGNYSSSRLGNCICQWSARDYLYAGGRFQGRIVFFFCWSYPRLSSVQHDTQACPPAQTRRQSAEL